MFEVQVSRVCEGSKSVSGSQCVHIRSVFVELNQPHAAVQPLIPQQVDLTFTLCPSVVICTCLCS